MSRVIRVIIVVLTVAVVSSPTPLLAYPTPQYDLTGVWKNAANQQIQFFQEKDQVNAVFVNEGWAHRLEGRYVGPTRIKLVLIRRTRANACEMTLTVDITVNSPTSFFVTSTATETACGLAAGQTFPEQFTRVH